ncbi:MAG: Small-conductance mechanosensitive channel [Labilithrix sp.]|nr:Small-conductance mechanosensitive channel [Labilithrix sp.]
METTVRWLTLAFERLVAFLPNLIAGLVILLLGYIIGLLLAKATRALAHRLGFDRFVARLGLGELRSEKTPSHFLGSVVFFCVMLAAVMQTAIAWNLLFVADGIARFIAYLPHLLAAGVVFAVALILGNWARDRLLRGAGEAEEPGTRIRVLPSAVRAGIIAFGSFMALRELQIAPAIVNAAFILIVAGAAVAVALAFGLGARGVAGRVAQSWYERRRGIEGGAGYTPGIEPPPTHVGPV